MKTISTLFTGFILQVFISLQAGDYEQVPEAPNYNEQGRNRDYDYNQAPEYADYDGYGEEPNSGHGSHAHFSRNQNQNAVGLFTLTHLHTDRKDPKSVHGQPLLNHIQGCVGCLEIRNFVHKKNLIV